MSIPITDKFKPKGVGGYALIDAEDVEMPDGTRLSEFEGNGTSVTIDTTLSQAGQAADAKAVGDALDSFNQTAALLIPKLLPDVTEADNGKALVVIDGVWTPVMVSVPSDDHINELIDAKLGVIENGTY